MESPRNHRPGLLRLPPPRVSGPDTRRRLLYITSGDDDNYVEGSDGSRATVLGPAPVFRCKPDGSRYWSYSLGFRNPYRDLAYDDKFNWFHVDNDNEDGSRFMGLPDHARRGGLTSAGAADRSPLLPAGSRSRRPLPANCPAEVRRCSRPAAVRLPAS